MLLTGVMVLCFATGWCQDPAQETPLGAAEVNRQWLLGTVTDALDVNDRARAGLADPSAVRAGQARLRKWLETVNPATSRTRPVTARVTDTIPREGYTIEKVLVEAEPFHHITALFYRPDPERYPPPWPGVVVACGHAHAAKGYPEYQKAGALCAISGLAALVFDPLDQGERIQALDDERQQRWWGTTGHNISGGPALLLGTSQAAYEIRDGAVAIDYLQSRPDIDGDRIGVMGNSGGGTQTALLMAMDDRVKAAAPSCYITAFQEMLTTIGPQDAEQFMPGQIAEGFDHADFLWVRAPMPVLVCATEDDFFPIAGTRRSVDAAREVFVTLGHPEALELAVVPGEHGWHQPLRERSVEWMCRWLDDRVLTVSEPEIKLLSEQEAWVTPTGKVMDLYGERSIHDLLADRLKGPTIGLPPGGSDPRVPDTVEPDNTDEITLPPALGLSPSVPTVEHEITGFSVHDGVLTTRMNLVCTPEEDAGRPWKIPVIRMRLDDTEPSGIRMIVRPAGVSAVATTERPTEDTELFLVDPRFCGDALQDESTRWSPFYGRFGADGQPAVMLMMLGRSLPGVQAEDLVTAATWIQDEDPIHLEAEGPPAVAARLAAAISPDLFEEVVASDTPSSYRDFLTTGHATARPLLVERQFSIIIPGVLPRHDLPAIDEAAGNRILP